MRPIDAGNAPQFFHVLKCGKNMDPIKFDCFGHRISMVPAFKEKFAVKRRN